MLPHTASNNATGATESTIERVRWSSEGAMPLFGDGQSLFTAV
ncbi:hypothetical protein [uncultured Methylobacterium sp.]